MKNKSKKKVAFEDRYLISCDLDGTLLNSKSEISEFSKKVIEKLIAKGHIFCINTARPFNSAAKYYNELKLTTPIVCHNGAYLFSPYECDFLNSNWCISHQILKAILTDKKILSLVESALIDAEKSVYILQKTNYSTKEIHKTMNELGIFIPEDIRMLNGHICAFKDTAFAIIFMLKNQEAIMDLIGRIKVKVPTVVTTIWKISPEIGSVVKVSSPYCSKGTALALLSSYYGIPEFRCYAFGDGRDDADMLKFASHGFAMKNGTDDAQIRANFVTELTNNDDGVCEILNNELKLGVKRNEKAN